MLVDRFHVTPPEREWEGEAYQDYLTPIIRRGPGGGRQVVLASFGMVPKRHTPQGFKPFATMNARTETIGQKPSFARFWHAGQLCLIPMSAFFEPNWETGKAVRWRIGLADDEPFAVAGIWRSWREHDGSESLAFTALTINVDDHPLMNRFHKPPAPGEPPDKRGLVIIHPADYDAWLNCHNPELARTFLQPYPAELMHAEPAPAVRPQQPKQAPEQGSLF
ncbi:SOS response-associated peptidase family protein [Crenobacter sp. SG2305]|uniref:SOS response-associated peptidase n=1 Tax=Crenobacter oryzisoli TaxID=3056844 RepID=UPI0025AAAC15|nr:SOS response-associated peptidase family protein [Crenobacter sp. SG2305]MDN0081792.1 SOS response-associated peptidase family protein [Crenobacter sp. SG2305]